jgi:phospholipase C
VAKLIDLVMRYSSFEKIKRFFVLVLENRSFDHMLGFSQISGIHAKTGEKTEIMGLTNIHAVGDGLEADEYNVDSNQTHWYAAAPTEFALQIDPGHEYGDMNYQLWTPPSPALPSGGTNAGFVLNNEYYINEKKQTDPDDPEASASPGVVMRCFLPEQIPILYYLAREYAVCDQWFCSGPLPTLPNRMFIHAASSGGLDNSPSGWDAFTHSQLGAYNFENGNIFERLDDAGIAYRIYAGDEAVSSEFKLGSLLAIEGMDGFEGDLGDENFSPRYVFIEPAYDAIWGHYNDGNSEHPYGNVWAGEMLIAKIYWLLSHSRFWWESALVILYDEGGGFYDHVPPPTTNVVPPGDAEVEGRNENGFDFTKLGPRVPAVVVSPWIPQGTIDHTQYDHTSLLKTVELSFGLDPLTDRDAHADNFAHLFRLQAPRDVHRPASGMTVSEGESATGDEASWPLMLSRGDFDETLRRIDAEVASVKRTATPLPARPPSTPIAELPRNQIHFLQVAFIEESKLRPEAQRSAVAERLRLVTTVGQARELLDSLKAERGVAQSDARDRRDRPEVQPPTTRRRTPH